MNRRSFFSAVTGLIAGLCWWRPAKPSGVVPTIPMGEFTSLDGSTWHEFYVGPSDLRYTLIYGHGDGPAIPVRVVGAEDCMS